nr:MAG TPA: hypothetical protein [Caudoviricetes sp.]
MSQKGSSQLNKKQKGFQNLITLNRWQLLAVFCLL